MSALPHLCGQDHIRNQRTVPFVADAAGRAGRLPPGGGGGGGGGPPIPGGGGGGGGGGGPGMATVVCILSLKVWFCVVVSKHGCLEAGVTPQFKNEVC